MSQVSKTLAIVGGGRWAQVTLSVIAKMHHPFNKIIIVSKINADEIKKIIHQMTPPSVQFNVVGTLYDLPKTRTIDAAIIVNSLDKHFISAQYFLNQGIPILLEKPLVVTSKEIKMLLNEAHYHSINLIPGLCYRFCSYIQHFSQLVSKKNYPIQFNFEWWDSQNELRYGQIKKHDSSISVLQDVLPHIWSILIQVFKTKEMTIHTAIDHHHHAEINIAIGKCNGKISLNRNASRRKRYLEIEFEDTNITLDFTNEPGIIFDGIKTYSADSEWETRDSPLTQQLNYFFSAIYKQQINEADIKDSLGSVAFTELVLNISAKNIGKENHASMEIDEYVIKL